MSGLCQGLPHSKWNSDTAACCFQATVQGGIRKDAQPIEAFHCTPVTSSHSIQSQPVSHLFLIDPAANPLPSLLPKRNCKVTRITHRSDWRHCTVLSESAL